MTKLKVHHHFLVKSLKVQSFFFYFFGQKLGTTLENDMAIFLKTGGKEFCDINLMLDGHIIPAHKSILSARCIYFQAMFRSFMPADNSVKVRN